MVPKPAPRAIHPELRRELGAIAAGIGCEVLDVELAAGTLRIFLDREEGGVTLADCERVSKELSAVLDVSDFGKGRYILEVSSPGLDRKLYGPRDYRRFTGRAVKVTYLREAEDGRSKRTVSGRLVAFSELDGGRAVVEEPRGDRLEIPLSDVQVARLEIEV